MSDTAVSLAPAIAPVTAPPAALPNGGAPQPDAADKLENKSENVKADTPFLSALVKQMRAQPGATGDEPAAMNLLPGDPALISSAPTDTKTPAAASPDGTALPPGGQSLPIDPTVLALMSPLAVAVASATAVAAASSVRSAAAPAADTSANRNPVTPANPTTAAPVTSPAAGLLLAELAQYAPAPPNHAAAPDAALPQPVGLNGAAATAQALPPVFNAITANDAARPAAPAPIGIPLAQPGWDQALGQRVQWLLGQQLQGAELRINPPHLGPIEVRVSLGQDQPTTINFASPHGVVRDAIESALPRLRDMLGDQGMNQVNVNVSQHSFAEQRRQASGSQGEAGEAAYRGTPFETSASERLTTIETVLRHTAGLVDYFA